MKQIIKKTSHAVIPMQNIGPIRISGPELEAEVMVPLATFETPLWPSTDRGARISRQIPGGIQAMILHEHMTRSVIVEAPSAIDAELIIKDLHKKYDEVALCIKETGRFVKLKEWHFELVGKLIYIRLAMNTGDASGHNMVTKAADTFLQFILSHYPNLKYVSISGNMCVDKKVSAINGILGRGKYVVAEIVIPRPYCQSILRTTPEKIVELNNKKNLLGGILAGSIRSANAHFANMLLAFYLATGQDAANIVEGSQGIVYAQLQGENLYFSVTLPNIIVGTVGNGKELGFVQENLKLLGCLTDSPPGHDSRRLSLIVAATVLCGELSLLAAQTNQGELMKSHLKLERIASTVSDNELTE